MKIIPIDELFEGTDVEVLMEEVLFDVSYNVGKCNVCEKEYQIEPDGGGFPCWNDDCGGTVINFLMEKGLV